MNVNELVYFQKYKEELARKERIEYRKKLMEKIGRLKGEIEFKNKELAKTERELSEVTEEIYGFSKEIAEGQAKTMRDRIIAMYINDNDPSFIIKALGASPNYVYKVLSTYRKKANKTPASKGERTRAEVIRLYDQVKDIYVVAESLDISVNYAKKLLATRN